jgi:DNA-binding CsgD family transcriptional regulator
MDDAERVSQLIGDIYDAALDRHLWPSVLEKTCGYIGGQSGALIAQGQGPSQAQLFIEWGTKAEFIESYKRTYAILNPIHVPTILHAKVGSILGTADLIPHEELHASRFYQEWLAPQGIVDAISATFEKSAMSYAMLAVHRYEQDGLVDDQTRRRMRLIAPHFQRAVGIAKIVDLQKFEAAALADSLDGIATAMILVDANGRIAHANTAGHALLAEGVVLRVADSKLASRDPRVEEMLHEIFMNAESSHTAIGAKGAGVLIKAPGGENWIAQVLPLTSGARRKAGLNYAAVAAVFVREAKLELPHPLETIASAYQLTTAEMRVLMAIVQIGGVPEVAPMLGIAEATVRTHLQRVFDKTGTKRQADLVKLAAGFMSPLA